MSAIRTVDEAMRNKRCTDFSKDGACSNCGECCADLLPLTKGEIARIKAYLKRHPITEQRNLVANTSIDFTCPFRSNALNKCLIYEVRPEICRVFMCNASQQQIDRNKLLFYSRCEVVSMREEFFEHGSALAVLHEVYKEITSKKPTQRGTGNEV